MERIEISHASPLMIRPNGRVRQRHVPGKYFFDLLARIGGEIGLGDQTGDPMAFVEPGKSRRNCQQIEDEIRREESSCQWSSRDYHYEISTLTKAGCRDRRARSLCWPRSVISTPTAIVLRC